MADSASPLTDPDLLLAFDAFASTLNFTHAAKRLGLSQPAVFERIQRLATELGVPLYRKVGRIIELTEHGGRVAAHAREVQEHEARFRRELLGERGSEVVKLAAGEGSYLYLIGHAIRRFVAERGAHKLQVATLGARDACAAVMTGEVHLAVCALDLVPARLSSDEIRRTRLCAAISTSHPLARRKTLRLEELAGERMIVAPAGQLHRDLVGRALGRVGLEVTDPIEADGWPLMLRFAELGLGVAFVNESCAPSAGLAFVPLPELGTITYRLVRRRGARLPVDCERLAALVLERRARA